MTQVFEYNGVKYVVTITELASGRYGWNYAFGLDHQCGMCRAPAGGEAIAVSEARFAAERHIDRAQENWGAQQ